MSKLVLTVTTGRPDAYLAEKFQGATDKHTLMRRVLNFIEGASTGTEAQESTTVPRSISIAVSGNAVHASLDLTCAAVIAGDTVTVNGNELTAVTGAVGVDEFARVADNTITATNLTAAINANALISAHVTATSAANVVTLTAVDSGVAGNVNAVITSGGTITPAGAYFAGGAADASAKTLTY